MSRRILFMGLVIVVSQIATGCCTQRAYIFPRLHCGMMAPPAVPMSPVVNYPIGIRPCATAMPVGPACNSCMASPGTAVSMAPRTTTGPIYTVGGPSYGNAVPADSMLLHQPTVIPPGTPKVEQSFEPKPMPKQ